MNSKVKNKGFLVRSGIYPIKIEDFSIANRGFAMHNEPSIRMFKMQARDIQGFSIKSLDEKV